MYKLFKHQSDAVSSMSNLREKGRGVILADEMGCGKTITMIETLRVNLFTPQHDTYSRVLIIVPLSLLQQWEEELKRVIVGVNIQLFHGTGRYLHESSRIVITTYDIVSRSYSKDGMKGDLHKVEWDSVVLDEAHYIRNYATTKKPKLSGGDNTNKAGKSVISLSKKFGYAMTGTPWCNRITDVYSLLDFISEDRSKSTEFNGDWIIRRTKKETLNLPMCREEISFVHSTPEIQAIRKKYLIKGKSAKSDYNHGDLVERAKATMKIITCALRIRQSSNSPFLVPDLVREIYHGSNSIVERSPKIKRARELVLSQLKKGMKTVIFSKFVEFLKLIEVGLEPLCDTQMFIGSMNRTTRDEAIDRFNNDPTCSVLLISIDCGGVGLNLTCASLAIIMEPWYNPFVEIQAQNRIDRIGQTVETRIVRIVDNSDKSADTWIRGIQQYKTKQASFTIKGLDVMNTSYNRGGDFTMKDFLSLFTKVDEYKTDPIEIGFYDKIDKNINLLTQEEGKFREEYPRINSEWSNDTDDIDWDNIPVIKLREMGYYD
jgi:transcription termination factor 2